MQLLNSGLIIFQGIYLLKIWCDNSASVVEIKMLQQSVKNFQLVKIILYIYIDMTV